MKPNGILLAVLVGVLVVVSLFAGAPVLAALPEGRVYEQVSPEFKAGYPVLGHKGYSSISLSGKRVEFASIGAFEHVGIDLAANAYIAHRTNEGWKTEAVSPYRTGECMTSPGGLSIGVVSPDLSRLTLTGALGATVVECQKSATNTLWARESGGSLRQASPPMTTVSGAENPGSIVEGSSSDLSRLVFKHDDKLPNHILPDEINDETIVGTQLYEVEGLHVRLLGVNNSGIQLTTYCDVHLGGQITSAGVTVPATFGAVSQPAASEVFFSVAVNSLKNTNQCDEPSSHPEQLFIRVNGSQTLEVSKPLGEACFEVPCPKAPLRAPAAFQGASEDGSTVYFTMADSASEPLVAGNKDHSSNLYVARIGCAGGMVGEACDSAPREVVSMELASPDVVTGQAAEVEPVVVAVSLDGSHAYFVAHGVLSETANGQGESAVDGAENLYVYNRSSTPGKVSFIADLCSGPESSGSIHDDRCPASLNEEAEHPRPPEYDGVNDRELWGSPFGSGHEAQTTQDGRFLAFGTFARLISSGPEADVDSSEDIYRYDAQTGSLRRVSIAEAGQEGNGNGSFDAKITRANFGIGAPQQQYELNDRAITDDGSRIVFTTSEPLSSQDATHKQDVYVWNEGRVGMISCGCSTENDEEPVITPSGNDIMFLTDAGLVPGDTDGLGDLYDARVHGGFPAPEAPREPCLADSCYGPLSTSAPILVPGSVTQPAGRNVPAPSLATPKTAAKTKPKAKKRKKTGKRRAKAKRSRARAYRSAHKSNGKGRGR